MAKVLARAQLPIKSCNPPKLPRFTKSLSFFSCRNVLQDLNFSLDRKIYSFIGVEKMQHSYKIWEEVKVYESFWTKIRNLRYFWDHFWVSEIFANDFSQVVWDERYFYKRVTGSFGSSSLNFNDFKLTTTIYRFYLTILVRLIQTWERMLGRERERKVEKKEKVCLREVGLDKGWSSLRQKIYLEGWTAEVRTRGEKDCWKFRWLLRRNKPSVSVKNIYDMRHLVDRRYTDTFPCTLPKWWSSRFYEVLSLMKPFNRCSIFSPLNLEEISKINNLKNTNEQNDLRFIFESIIERS